MTVDQSGPLTSLSPYAKAGAVSLVAVGLQLLLDPYTTPSSYQALLGAVAISAIRWGRTPAIFSLLLCGLAKLYIFLPPKWTFYFGTPTLVRLVLFLAIGSLLVWMGGRLHRVADTLALTLSSIADVVIATDLNERVVFLNPAAQVLTGRSPDQCWGKPLNEVLTFADRASLQGQSLAQRVLTTGEPIPSASRVLVAANGRQVPVEISAAPIPSGSGTLGVIFVARDASQQSRAHQMQTAEIRGLQTELSKARILSGTLAICAACKKVQDEQGDWEPIELYLEKHSEAGFTHGICSECVRQMYPQGAGKRS